MPIPTHQSLMLPLLRLASAPDGVTLQDAVQKLSQEFQLSAEEAEQRLRSGQRVIYNRTGWAATELVAAGLIERPRPGLMRITEVGKALLSETPATISRAYLMERYPEFRAYIEASRQPRQIVPDGAAVAPSDLANAPTGATPDEQIDAAARTLTSALEADLLARVRAVRPTQFEQIVIDLLTAMGFGGGDPEMGQRLGRSGDGGIDGVIQEDALGLDAVYVQAKRYQDGSAIGAPALQAFVGSLVGKRATKGVFVTASHFSPAAKQYIDTVQHRVVLIDGKELARLLVRHGVGARDDRRVIIKKLDEEYFSE